MGKILKTYKDVAPYLELVCRYGDENKKELGFLPRFAYEDQAAQDKLWIAKLDKEYAGHLMFGGRFPTLKVFQLFIHENHRGKGIAARLIKALAEYGEDHQYLSIGARVAEDLEANLFWEKMGFKLIRKIPGGATTKRIINLRSKTLNTPSLLSLIEDAQSRDKRGNLFYKDRPIRSSQNYAIDLNVLFDVLRPHRCSNEEACSVISAALSNKIKLCVTDEFTKELERNSNVFKEDPVLAFARQLPTLEHVKPEDIRELEESLRVLIFPTRSKDRKDFLQDQSDLRHLAKSIVNGVDGFITREKAILRAKDKIRDKYALQILPPSEFLESQVYEEGICREVLSQHQNQHIQFTEAKYSDSKMVADFLQDKGVDASISADVLRAGASGANRRRWIVRAGGQLIAVAAWDVPSRLSQEVILWLFADEEHFFFEIVVDHVFESMSRDNPNCRARKIILNVAPGQDRTKDIAIQRGFRGNNKNGQLIKISFTGIITVQNWPRFIGDFKYLSGLTLPINMPSSDDGDVVLTLIDENSDKHELSVFDLETLISPAILLCPGRAGVMIPIKPRFAKDLGIIPSAQLGLLPGSEAILHTEKAYFRSKSGANKFKKGMPIFFYVSREQRDEVKGVVGLGRITYSNIHTVNEINNKFSRQGVLPERTLNNIGDKNNKLHVFTFDNFNKFSSKIPYEILKHNSIISAANLTSPEFKTSEELIKIIDLENGLECMDGRIDLN